MEMSRAYAISAQHLLHPMMWICALAVIVLSIVGIASMTGWMPHGLESGARAIPATTDRTAPPDAAKPDFQMQRSVPGFQCIECGVIDSIRDIERRSAVSSAPIAA